MSFLHGVEIKEIDAGPRPIRTVATSVIGVVGTAPDATEEEFPLNKPVRIDGSRKKAAGLGATGTLPMAVDGIFDQTGAVVVVVRVEQVNGSDEDRGTIDKVLGTNGGLSALAVAESSVHVSPKILIAPGFSHRETVLQELEIQADRLRAVAIADCPETDPMTYAEKSGSSRMFLVYPKVLIGKDRREPASARVAGVLARSDNERGWWWSPSNRPIAGILGTEPAIEFALGDETSYANTLNANKVATIIHQGGYRLWGNRSCNTDPKWQFLSVRRTADILNESLLRAHLWAVDRNITKTYVEDVLEGVNAFLRNLKARGAILGGNCWMDPELNTPDQIALGKVYFDFDFTPPYPAEHIGFQSRLVNDYIEEVLP